MDVCSLHSQLAAFTRSPSAHSTCRGQMRTVVTFKSLLEPSIYKLSSSSWKLLAPHPIPEVVLAFPRSDRGNTLIIPQGLGCTSYTDCSGTHAAKPPLSALKTYPLVLGVVLGDRAVIQGPGAQQAAVHTVCWNPVRQHCAEICRLQLAVTEIKGIASEGS